MRTLIIDEEGKPPVLIRYHINLLGEIEPEFLDRLYSVPRLKYYKRVLIEHVKELKRRNTYKSEVRINDAHTY